LLHDYGFDQIEAERLFRTICSGLHRRQKMPAAIWRGTHIEDVEEMLRTAQRYAKKTLGLTLVLASPFMEADITRKDVYFRRLAEIFAADRSRRVALVGLAAPEFHWTLVTAANSARLRLYDSGSRRELLYANCTLGEKVRRKQIILPHETRILELRAPDPVRISLQVPQRKAA
jgi:hypothetical protein